MTENAVFRGGPATNYHIYQYDDPAARSATNTAWSPMSSRRTTTPLPPRAGIRRPPESYELRVYTSPTSGPINPTGPAAVKTGTISTAGYHTMAFDTPVPVSAGQSFSVVVKQTTPGYNYPVPLEKQYTGYSGAAWAATGQSYMSGGGTSWTDVAASYPNTNVCLKAFSSAGPAPTPGTLGVNPSTGLSSNGTGGRLPPA